MIVLLLQAKVEIGRFRALMAVPRDSGTVEYPARLLCAVLDCIDGSIKKQTEVGMNRVGNDCDYKADLFLAFGQVPKLLSQPALIIAFASISLVRKKGVNGVHQIVLHAQRFAAFRGGSNSGTPGLWLWVIRAGLAEGAPPPGAGPPRSKPIPSPNTNRVPRPPNPFRMDYPSGQVSQRVAPARLRCPQRTC